MNQNSPAPTGLDKSLAEWKARLLKFVFALFVYEFFSGLALYVLPFSVWIQFNVLVHTALGLIFAAAYLVYQVRHYLVWRAKPFSHIKALGWASCLSLVPCSVTGVWLTAQAWSGTRIDYTLDLIHTVSGLAAGPIVALHVLVLIYQARKRRAAEGGAALRKAQWTLAAGYKIGGIALFLVPTAMMALYKAPPVERAFPKDYSWRYGDNPFAPSLVRTAGMKGIEPEMLALSKTCGDAGCHEEIVHEWEASGHRYASMSPFFQAIQITMAQNNGAESTRYCAGCHDPIALFSGSKNIYRDDLTSYGADEGVSCVACHSITKTDVQGNANYTLTPQPRYLYETDKRPGARTAGRFLIRAYPRRHVAGFTKPLYKTPEFCGACHKQFIDESINNVGWVQLQNQYDNWRQSHWNKPGDEKKTVTCRECHMRLSDSQDPARGDSADYYRSAKDRKHRNHRFIGANQVHPKLLNLPGADEHVRLTEEWLKGDTPLPEIAHKWTKGPAVPISLETPKSVRPGEEVKVRVIVSSNKPGHDFPTGPLDIIQSWIALRVTDMDTGEEVFRSGGLDEKHFIEPGTAIFKAEGIDQYGNLIDKHNLWEMVGARFKRNLFPGYSDAETYEFPCPSNTRRAGEAAVAGTEAEFKAPNGTGRLKVEAVLRYRKADQYLLNFLVQAKLLPDNDLTAPVTDMSRAEAVIQVDG